MLANSQTIAMLSVSMLANIILVGLFAAQTTSPEQAQTEPEVSTGRPINTLEAPKFVTPLPPKLATVSQCQTLLQETQKHLAATNAEIRRRTPAHIRYAEEPPNSALTESLNAYFHRFAQRHQGVSTPSIDCRGNLCLVRARSDAAVPSELDWIPQGMVDRVDSFPEGGDILTIVEPGTKNGMAILTEAIRRFRASHAVSNCGEKNGTVEGPLEVMLTLRPPDPAIQVQAGGSLSLHPIGRCLVEGLRRVADELVVEPPFTGATLYSSVHVPALQRTDM
jgi:hypothetical protein